MENPMRLALRSLAIATTLAVPMTLAFARGPANNVSAGRHPNIAAAQRLATQAFEKLSQAQSANEFDMGGHAQKAKDALKIANDEMKLAAEAANTH
jgi:hypothetical protein